MLFSIDLPQSIGGPLTNSIYFFSISLESCYEPVAISHSCLQADNFRLFPCKQMDKGQTSEQRVNRLKKITWASVFRVWLEMTAYM
jgi:hypothetical protein